MSITTSVVVSAPTSLVAECWTRNSTPKVLIEDGNLTALKVTAAH